MSYHYETFNPLYALWISNQNQGKFWPLLHYYWYTHELLVYLNNSLSTLYATNKLLHYAKTHSAENLLKPYTHRMMQWYKNKQ